jgi:hypothetical protein
MGRCSFGGVSVVVKIRSELNQATFQWLVFVSTVYYNIQCWP